MVEEVVRNVDSIVIYHVFPLFLLGLHILESPQSIHYHFYIIKVAVYFNKILSPSSEPC